MSQGLSVHKGSYVDSLVLMSATVSMEESPGVSWAGAYMATGQARDDLVSNGFSPDELGDAGPNDLVLAVKADDDGALDTALEAGRTTALRREESAAATSAAEAAPASIADAASAGEVNVAIVSVPGEYAALEAHHALTAGLHVLLFSDGVSLAEEVELKTRAEPLGRLIMGPGAGTSIIGGTGLGFANVMTSKPISEGAVGVVAAAGTGAQEVSALLSRWGVRVDNVIGVGGRDLSQDVGGRAAKMAARALDQDDGTSAVLLVSKPPAAAVAADVLAQCQNTPAVAVFLGLDESSQAADHTLARTLESGVRAAAELVGVTAPPTSQGLRDAVAAACDGLASQRTLVRGFFSGGTLCYEAQLLLEGFLGPIYSNEPLRKEHHTPAPDGAHVLLDLGAEEYTRGVPHPMIDPHKRIELLREQAGDEQTAVVLLDVVLGYGSHEDPAGELAPVLAELMGKSGPRVVAYVLGTEDDPQGYSRQRAKLEEVGCIVPETNARAALVAAAIAARRPEIAESEV
jgi:FdrA protein